MIIFTGNCTLFNQRDRVFIFEWKRAKLSHSYMEIKFHEMYQRLSIKPVRCIPHEVGSWSCPFIIYNFFFNLQAINEFISSNPFYEIVNINLYFSISPNNSSLCLIGLDAYGKQVCESLLLSYIQLLQKKEKNFLLLDLRDEPERLIFCKIYLH